VVPDGFLYISEPTNAHTKGQSVSVEFTEWRTNSKVSRPAYLHPWVGGHLITFVNTARWLMESHGPEFCQVRNTYSNLKYI